MKKIIILIVLIVALIGAIFFIIREDDTSEPEAKQPVIIESEKSTKDSEHPQLIIGQEDAPLSIIAYEDYKCPNCATFHTGAYQELKRDYIDTGKVKIVFRNQPYINEDSFTAAEGTYCANEQDLFERYHDTVYDFTSGVYAAEGTGKEYENILTPARLSGFIDDIGGERSKFRECLDSHKYKQAVDSDLKSGERDQVSGTPTFLIADQRIVGAQPITTFRPLLENNR